MNDSFNPYAPPSTARSEPTENRAVPAALPNELRRIAAGLDFIRAALVLFLVNVLAFIALITILQLGEVPGRIHPLILLGFETTLVVAHALWLWGSSRCLTSPLSARAHPLVAATVIAQVLSLILTIGSFLNVRTIGGRSTQELVAAAGCMTFILFLRKLSRYLGRPNLARRASVLLVAWGALVVAIVAAFVTFLTMIANMPRRHAAVNPVSFQVYLAANLVLFFVGIGAVVGFFTLLGAVKSAILESGEPVVE